MKNEIFLTKNQLKLILNKNSINDIVAAGDIEMLAILADHKILGKDTYNNMFYSLLNKGLVLEDSVSIVKEQSSYKNAKLIDFLSGGRFKNYFDIDLILEKVDNCVDPPLNLFCLFRKDINCPALKNSLNTPEVKEKVLIQLIKIFLGSDEDPDINLGKYINNKITAKIIDTPAINQIILDFPKLNISTGFIREINNIFFKYEKQDYYNGLDSFDASAATPPLILDISPIIDIYNKNFFIPNFMEIFFDKISKSSKLKTEITRNRFVKKAALFIEDWMFEDSDINNNLINNNPTTGESNTIYNDNYQTLLSFLGSSLYCQDSLSVEENKLLSKIAKMDDIFAMDLKKIKANNVKKSIAAALPPPKNKNKFSKI